MYELNLDNYIEYSDTIVMGTIQDIKYYSDNDIPWTELVIKIDEVIYGNQIDEQKISVFDMGGYLTVADFEKYYGELSNDSIDYVYMDFFQEMKYHIGNSGIFFITPKERFKKNGYDLVGSSYSAMIYNDDINKYEYSKEEGVSEFIGFNDVEQVIESRKFSEVK